MPKEGWDCLNIKSEDYEKIKKISEEEGMKNYYIITKALKTTYPDYFS